MIGALLALIIAVAPLPVSERQPLPTPNPVKAGAGEVVVVSFWASWCRPCLAELPRLTPLLNSKVRGVAISVDTQAAPARAAAKKLHLEEKWTVLFDKDGAQLLPRVLPAANVPVVVVLDKRGRVAFRREGFRPGGEADVKQIVDALVAE